MKSPHNTLGAPPKEASLPCHNLWGKHVDYIINPLLSVRETPHGDDDDDDDDDDDGDDEYHDDDDLEESMLITLLAPPIYISVFCSTTTRLRETLKREYRW